MSAEPPFQTERVDAALAPSPQTPTPTTTARPAWHRTATLLLAGANLTLVQFVALREFAAILGSNELVVLLVVAAYFLGISAGYGVSQRVTPRGLALLGAGTLLLHATLPFSARGFAGVMAAINLAGNTPPFLFALALFGTTPFYAIFLPRLIDGADAMPSPGGEAPHSTLVRCYATELVGGLMGLLVVLVLTPARMEWIAAVHLAGLATLWMFLNPMPRWARVLIALLPVAYVAAWPALNRSSLEYLYRETHRVQSARFVASEYSPYQRVDLMAMRGRSETRASTSTNLYLNGNLLYGTAKLHEHNLMVAVAPNLLRTPEPRRALVIAGGSLDNARHLAPRIAELHVVELDEVVARLSRKHLQEPRGGFPTNWTLTIDDGKHFLGTWKGGLFDTIAVDVPIPSHVQTAMLHSERFFGLARSRLAPGGVFSISLAGRLNSRERGSAPSRALPARILAGLAHQFTHVMVARLGDIDFAWASDRPFDLDAPALQARIDAFCDASTGGRRVFGRPRVTLLSPSQVAEAVVGVPAIGEADMQIAMRLSLGKLRRRYYDPD